MQRARELAASLAIEIEESGLVDWTPLDETAPDQWPNNPKLKSQQPIESFHFIKIRPLPQEGQRMEIDPTGPWVQDQAKHRETEGELLEKNQETSDFASKRGEIPAHIIRQHQIIHAKVNAPLPQNDPTRCQRKDQKPHLTQLIFLQLPLPTL